MRVAVVGATGAVGRELVAILAEREFVLDELLLFASERSEGKRFEFRGETLTVRATHERWFDGIDLAFVSAGTPVSREIVPPAAAAGTYVIDNSSAFRQDPNVPLVVPEINPHALRPEHRLVANGNCTAITALMPMAPLHRRFGLRTVITSSYQSVSGAGWRGVRELTEQVEKLHGQGETLGHPDRDALPVGDVFPRTIAFNVIPQAETFKPDAAGYTTEELKMGWEFRKVLEAPEIRVAATAVRVPVPVSHGVSIHATFSKPVTPEAARAVLAEAPGVRVVDDPIAGEFPTPLDAAGIDDVLVGRIRQSELGEDSLALWSVGDNLRKGAALNMVQIAELVARRQKS